MEAKALPNEFLQENMETMKPEVLARISVMRGKVSQRLGETPAHIRQYGRARMVGATIVSGQYDDTTYA